MTNPPPPIALYVHWPWCLSKCPYCDFASRPRETGLDEGRWSKALLGELDRAAERIGPRRLTSIFFGGGTPSLMPPSLTGALIDRAVGHWQPREDLEITMEANPGASDQARFRDFRQAGINRLSLGVQALDDKALRRLGRSHDLAQAQAAIRTGMEIFPRFSLDLIYARPGQDEAAWRSELKTALAFETGHLSLYQLTIEEGTAFHAKGVAEAEEELAARLFAITAETTAEAGMPAYEISNHARPGEECRHNLVYWQGGDYLGIGPAAHGRITLQGRTFATVRPSDPHNWLTAAETGTADWLWETGLAPEERMAELLMMGLRTASGMDRQRFLTLTGREIETAVDLRALAELEGEGLLVCDEKGLRATRRGFPLLNAIIAKLLT